MADASESDNPKWLARKRTQVEGTIDRARTELEARRETSSPIALAFDAYGHDTQTGGPVLAAALAFRIFLFYVPYAFFVVFAFGIGADAGGDDPTAVARRSGMGGLIARAVGSAATESTTARIVAISLSGYACFLGARGIVKVLRIVHGLVWQVPVPRLKHSSRAALILIAVTTGAIALSVGISALTGRFIVGGIVALLLYVAVPFVVWWYVSWLLPHGPVDGWALVPGAALFAIGVSLLHLFTVVYFPHLVSSKSSTYGAIGLALVVLFWAYLIGRCMTASAVLNAALYFRRVATDAGTALPSFGSVAARSGGLFGLQRAIFGPATKAVPKPEPDPMSFDDLVDIVDSARALQTPLVVAFDGFSASGKSTVAQRLAERVPACIIHMDDFYRDMPDADRRQLAPREGIDQYFDWTRLRDEALIPLRRGEVARFRPYAWDAGGGLEAEREVPYAPVIIVEGVYAARPELRDLVDVAVLVVADDAMREARRRARHDPVDWEARWDAAEQLYFTEIRPAPGFDHVVGGTP